MQKDELLEHLKQFTQPVALRDIKKGLDLPERTLRRYLAQLVDEGKIQAEGKLKGRRYCYISQSTSSSEQQPAIEIGPSNLVYSSISQQLMAQIRQPLFQRQPCTYQAQWIDAYTPNETYYLTENERDLLHNTGSRLSQELPAGTYARKIFNRLLIDLSYHSSRLEGNTYSLVDTQKLLLEGTAAEGKMDVDKVMILNHKDAIQFLVDGINRLQISMENIQTLHYLLADGLVAPGAAGHIRQDAVRVSSTTYMPMEGQQRLTAQLEKLIGKAASIDDPFEQSFFLLVHISYLQAFIDVNKRTARLSANIPLVRHNLVPLSFTDIDKDDYATAVIVTYERNEIRPLAELYVYSYLRSCTQYSVVTEAMGIDTMRVLYRETRRRLISQVVSSKLVGSQLKRCIEQFTQEEIPIEHQAKFMADVVFDLNNLQPFSISGMGISQRELEEWKVLYLEKGAGF
ncbi:Fic family protein [Zooshikella marina]|uniref:Fic family protein n=1 Tax=Zooshikella ganghwensis TaxID=202772 RepID=UPI001BAEEE1B|nr:Fic family protein [Zooshikella ganghwensis]MBU2709281.1 Fic family protein [Zooshikella ganghwensis]